MACVWMSVKPVYRCWDSDVEFRFHYMSGKYIWLSSDLAASYPPWIYADKWGYYDSAMHLFVKERQVFVVLMLHLMQLDLW